jgi:hypothetical protein
VQKKAIVPLARGNDMIVQAQSGTGKTGAFTIGTLARVDSRASSCQVLVLNPIRELATQTAGVYAEVAFRLGVHVTSLVGGTRMQQNRIELRRSQVVVGTPGRVIDCMRRGWLDLSKLRCFVLDEADEMLKRDFVDAVRDVARDIPSSTQVCVVVRSLHAHSLVYRWWCSVRHSRPTHSISRRVSLAIRCASSSSQRNSHWQHCCSSTWQWAKIATRPTRSSTSTPTFRCRKVSSSSHRARASTRSARHCQPKTSPRYVV